MTTIDLDILVRTGDDPLTYYPAMSTADRGPLVTAQVVHALADAHPAWTPPAIPAGQDTVRLDALALETLIADPPAGLGAHLYVVAPGSAWLLCSECGPLQRILLAQGPAARDEHNRRLQHRPTAA